MVAPADLAQGNIRQAGAGISLGYLRNQSGGTWVVRVADGKGGNWEKAIGGAGDFSEANNETVFDFWQAQARAKSIATGSNNSDAGTERNLTKAVTVGQALDDLEADLKTRGGDAGNADRVRVHLTAALKDKPVALLTRQDLAQFIRPPAAV
jgi:hypothetical protein